MEHWVRSWADEIPDSEPLPRLEPFYVLAALEFGDPDSERWLEHNAGEFHQLYRRYREAGAFPNPLPFDSGTVLIQYMIWYDRDSRNLKEGNPR